MLPTETARRVRHDPWAEAAPPPIPAQTSVARITASVGHKWRNICARQTNCYIVRRNENDQRYSVWDAANDKPAVVELRECIDLGFNEAFEIAERLNAESRRSREDA